MFRLTILVFLTCALAGAAPLAWNWDIFQPANSLLTSSVFSPPPDAVNLIANSYPSNIADVANWLPTTLALSDFQSKNSGDDESGVGIENDLRGENEAVPDFVLLDLSTLFGHPQIVSKHRIFGSMLAAEGTN